MAPFKNKEITIDLVNDLIQSQFPQWADLPIQAVAQSGWDNRTFHLGQDMSVRLPSAERYVAQVEKEQKWLPHLGPQLPLPIPQPIALGKPSDDYPWPWSVYHWIDGENLSQDNMTDPLDLAKDLAYFLKILQKSDTQCAPKAGPHNFFRGGPLKVYDHEAQEALKALQGEIDTALAQHAWERALSSQWESAPVWVHGDISPGNLLVSEGKLSAVIDFGSCGIGDPACDWVMAWTFFKGESRSVFQQSFPDIHLWERAKGWALWKALITLQNSLQNPIKKPQLKALIHEILSNDFEMETPIR